MLTGLLEPTGGSIFFAGRDIRADLIGYRRLLGYVPEGLKKTAGMWKAPIQDYNFGGEEALLSTKVISYLISGAIGVVLACLVVMIISKLVFKNER